MKDKNVKSFGEFNESVFSALIKRINIMKYIKLFENFDEYNYDNAKNNPDKIVIKFNDAGYDKFWNQYIKPTDDSTRGLGDNWVYFDSWGDLERPGGTHHDAKGLEMTDGEYYLLFKTYDKKEVDEFIGINGKTIENLFCAGIIYYFLDCFSLDSYEIKVKI